MQSRKTFPVTLCMLSVGQHNALFLGIARFPKHSNSSRKSVLLHPTCHSNLPHCPRLSGTEKPKLLRTPSTESYLKTPYLLEKVILRSCCKQCTVLPLTLQGFTRSKAPIAYLERSLREAVCYTANSVPRKRCSGKGPVCS